jgi:hypothetical protein
MKKMKLLIPILLLTPVFAEFQASIYTVAPKLKAKMIEGNSWHRGCPVDTIDLRYLRLTYMDFQGEDRVGELIVHKEVAQSVVSIMRELYEVGYPIHQMKLVSDFDGNDWKSIEADNTSAFNCRNATGSKKWSKHSYGMAIDINPIENPYISRRGHISHKASQQYRKRIHKEDSLADRAVLLQNDKATKIFKSYGFSWGGDWRYTKDYQHFVKKTP